jgi:hypothetical protein
MGENGLEGEGEKEEEGAPWQQVVIGRHGSSAISWCMQCALGLVSAETPLVQTCVNVDGSASWTTVMVARPWCRNMVYDDDSLELQAVGRTSRRCPLPLTIWPLISRS